VDSVNDAGRTAAPPAVKALLEEFSGLFKKPTTLPPLRPGMQHTIDLEEGATPPAKAPFRLSWAEQEELKKQLQELLEQGLIVPSLSPYGAPVLLVKKKDGSYRMCVDYRQLNKITIRDRFPLPLIQELLDRLQGATVFSKMDLKSGYFQLRVEPKDEGKTAFVTKFGTFQFRVLPMGMSNAPSTFQRAMETILRPYLDKSVAVYLDDILIYSRNMEEHITHLRQVLEAFRKHELLLHGGKCEFARDTVVFLGHTVSANAVAVEAEKVRAIRQWAMPKTKVQLQQLLGFANFYRSFVPGFARRDDYRAPHGALAQRRAVCPG
jgi:hypothetical protein